jgi:hypothetical protein
MAIPLVCLVRRSRFVTPLAGPPEESAPRGSTVFAIASRSTGISRRVDERRGRRHAELRARRILTHAIWEHCR